LYESGIAVKAKAKWFEKYWDLHGAGAAQGKKNEVVEMMLAKVGRDGITTQLETAATKIIGAAKSAGISSRLSCS